MNSAEQPLGLWSQAARATAGTETGVQTPLEGTIWDYSRDPGKAGTLRPGGQLPGTRHQGPHQRGPLPADGSDVGRTNTPTPSRPAGRGNHRQNARARVLDREAPPPPGCPCLTHVPDPPCPPPRPGAVLICLPTSSPEHQPGLVQTSKQVPQAPCATAGRAHRSMAA